VNTRSLLSTTYVANALSRDGKEAVKVDGQTLSIAAVTATARYNAAVELDGSPHIKDRVAKSRAVISQKVESGASVYGLSTGFGGSGSSRRAFSSCFR